MRLLTCAAHSTKPLRPQLFKQGPARIRTQWEATTLATWDAPEVATPDRHTRTATPRLAEATRTDKAKVAGDAERAGAVPSSGTRDPGSHRCTGRRLCRIHRKLSYLLQMPW